MHITIEIGRLEFEDMIYRLGVKEKVKFKQVMIDTTRKQLGLRKQDSVDVRIIEV